MRRSYLFVYDDMVGKREQVKAYLDRLPEVLNWRYDLPHTFYIVSNHSAQELSDRIRAFTRDNGRFLITEIADNKQGWLPKETWTTINRKLLPGQNSEA